MSAKAGFAVRKDFEGFKDFDTDYIDIKLVKVVKKVGPGDEDFILEDKEVITKKPIREVIDASKGDAGLDNYLKPYILTGQDLPSVEVSDEITDFASMPDTLADALDLQAAAKINFESLDPALRGDAKTPDEFFANFTIEKFNNFINSKIKREEKIENEK